MADWPAGPTIRQRGLVPHDEYRLNHDYRMEDIWLGLRLLLLLGAANTAPIVIKRVLGGRWNAPLDAGLRFVDGRPLLGPSKTVRGLVAAVVGSTFARGHSIRAPPSLRGPA